MACLVHEEFIFKVQLALNMLHSAEAQCLETKLQMFTEDLIDAEGSCIMYYSVSHNEVDAEIKQKHSESQCIARKCNQDVAMGNMMH